MKTTRMPVESASALRAYSRFMRGGRRALVGLAALALLGGQTASAAAYYWDGVSSSWTNVLSWSTAPDAGLPNPLTVPGSGDDAIFNIAIVNGAETVTLDAAQAANSLTFSNTGATVLRGNNNGATARALTLGAGGLTLVSGAGAVILGENPATNGTINFTIGAAQSWTNDSGSALVVTGNNATAITLNSLLTIDGSGNTTLGHGARLAGSAGMRKTGGGVLTIGNVSAAGARFTVGPGYGGDFTMDAGTLIVGPSSYFTMGEGAGGAVTVSYTQTGGAATYTASGGLYLGNWTGGMGNNALFTVSGGTFVQNLGAVYVGRQQTAGTCTGTLTVGGGAGAAAFTAPTVSLGGAGANTNNTGYLNLVTNGTLEASLINKPGGVGSLYFDGGTFRVRAGTATNSTVLANVLNAAQIKNGGATVDTAGIHVTIAQDLANFPGDAGPFTKAGVGVLTLSGSNTYSGGTTVSGGLLNFPSTAAKPAVGSVTVLAAGGLGLGVGGAGYFSIQDVEDLWDGILSGVTIDPASLVGIDTSTGDLTYATPRSTRGLFKLGANTLTLSGSNTYSGGTAVHAGLLCFATTAAKPAAGTVTVLAGAGLGLGVGDAGYFSLADVDALWSNALAGVSMDPAALVGIDTSAGGLTYATPQSTRGLVKLGANTLWLTATNTYPGGTRINGGTLSIAELADAGPSAIANSGTLTFGGGTLQFTGATGGTGRALAFAGAGTFDVPAGSVLLITNGAWSGSGGIAKTGDGTLEVGTNTVSTSLTLRFIVDNLRGGNFTMASGILNVRPGRFFTIGDTASTGTSVFHQTGGTVTFAPTGTTSASDIYVGNAGSPGELLVRGGDFVVGATSLQIRVGQAMAGTLAIGGGATAASVTTPKISVGVGAGNGVVNIESNGTLIASLVADGGGGGASSLYFDGGTLRVSSNFTVGAMLSGGMNVAQVKNGGATIDTNGKDATNLQAIANFPGHSGSLTKVGAGTLIASANYSAGAVTVAVGTLSVNTPTGDGFNPSTKSIVVNPNATLKFGGGHKIENAVIVTLSPDSWLDMGGQPDAIGGLVGTGTLSNTGAFQTLTLDLPASMSFDGRMTGNLGLQLRGYTSSGTVQSFTLLNTSNDFSGGVTLGENTVNMRGDPVLVLGTSGVIPDSAVVAVLGSAAAAGNGYFKGTLDLNAFNETIAGLAGGAPSAGDKYGTVLNHGANEATLTVNVAGGSQTFSGIIADGLSKMALLKTGGGTQVLAGTNTYTGDTTVNAGTLLVNGQIGTSAVTVASGGTLGGTGVIEGPVANAGVVAPGASPGTLVCLGAYTQEAAGTLRIEIGGPGAGAGHDRLDVFGGATLGGTLEVAFVNGYTGLVGDTFIVVSSVSLAGDFAATNLPPLGGVDSWVFEKQGGGVVLTITNLTSLLTGYDAWASQYGLTLGPEGDSDGDGYANLLEYATGGDPIVVDAIARLGGYRSNAVLWARFWRNTNATDVTILLEAANMLTAGVVWDGLATNQLGIWKAPAGLEEIGGITPAPVKVPDVADVSNRFLRLRVTRP